MRNVILLLCIHLLLTAERSSGQSDSFLSASKNAIYTIGMDGSNLTILHRFDSGEWVTGNLILDENRRVYGVNQGYDLDPGFIFSIDPSGGDYQVVYEFQSGDARKPRGGLILLGDSLYGLTAMGGTSSLGTIYRVARDGKGFEILHSFNFDNGSMPSCRLTLAGGFLYGTTLFGGKSGEGSGGTVFKVTSSGSEFVSVHAFDKVDAAGGLPASGLSLYSNGTLYGMTQATSSGSGSIYRVDPNEMGIVVAQKTDRTTTGESSHSNLLLGSDDRFYATTRSGGQKGYGTIIGYSPGSASLEVLHDFDSIDGFWEGGTSQLIESSDGFLYGTTDAGGQFGLGVLFKLHPNGTGFEVLHHFKEIIGSTENGVLIPVNSPITGVSEPWEPKFSLFPNPASDWISFNLDIEFQQAPVQLILYDVKGAERGRYPIPWTGRGYATELDVSEMPPGTVCYLIFGQRPLFRGKLVKDN